MKLERAKPEDAQECISWLKQNSLNDLSPRTLKGAIFYKIPGVLYLPVKAVLMLDSLGPNPQITGKKRLLALRRAMDDLRQMYPNTEMLFLTRGGSQLDEAAKFYGFQPSSFTLYRFIPDANKEKRTNHQSVAETRLRNHARAVRRQETKAARSVRGVHEAA